VSNAPQQRGSIFSGLLLIFLGAVFLFEHFHPAFRLWHYFYRFWPLLLIVWGIAKIIDHLSAQRSGEGKPPLLSGGEAALMVLVIFVFIGLGVKSWIMEKNPGLNLDVDLFSKNYSETEELPAKALPANAHVTLSTERGDIAAHTGESDSLRVMVKKSASGPTESAAQERMKKVKVVIEQTGGGYVVHPVNQEDSEGILGLDLDVTLPPQTALWANTSHGNISVSQVAGSVTAGSGQGDIEIHNAGSDVSAKMSKGDVRITGIAGNVSVAGHGNEIEISDVRGNAQIDGDFFGPIRVRSVAGTAHYHSQKADITLVSARGRLELDSERIEISDVNGSSKLNTHNKDIDVENVSGRLDITDTKGNIKVRYSQAPREDINIADDSGEVDVTLPSNSNFEISAISQSGEVQSDFQEPGLKLTNENGTGRLSGKVGAGGPKIHITTSYGTIYLRKSS
jgi:putative adhesin/cell wall-active antibiotic response 4TMS protein YvqF